MFLNYNRVCEASLMFHRVKIVGTILSYGKRCAFCLTYDDEALGRRTNDFTRIGTLKRITVSHYYVSILKLLETRQ